VKDERKIPGATIALIAANLLVAFAIQFVPSLLDIAAFNPAKPTMLATFACLFAHANLLHLLANMVFLAAVGPLIEFTRGWWRYLLIYICGGLLGVAAHWMISNQSPPGTQLLGASGAIAACVGYCSIRFARTKVPLAPNFGVPVGAIALIWVLVQAAGVFVKIGEPVRGGVGFWAHLGGFLAGLILAFIFGGLKEARFQYGHEVLERMNDRGPAATLAAAEAILTQQPKSRTALWQKVEALHDLGEDDQCAETAVDFIANGTPDEVESGLKMLVSINRIEVIPALQRLKYADQLSATNQMLSANILRSVGDDKSESRRPDALLSLCDLLKTLDPVQSQAYARILNDEFPLHPATETAKQKGLLA